MIIAITGYGRIISGRTIFDLRRAAMPALFNGRIDWEKLVEFNSGD